VGQLLKQLDDLGIADNTIVLYTTDNGAEVFSWPDGGTTPFHGEKNSSWEGGYRVPGMIRYPGVIKPGTLLNGIGSHEDWLPTLLAAAGEPQITEKLLNGHTAGEKTFKVHLDGYNMLDYFAGKAEDPRREFFYWTDDGNLAGLRYDRWKLLFLQQKEVGFKVWSEPLTPLRVPLIIDLRADPFERAPLESSEYDMFTLNHAFLCVPAQAFVGQHLQTYLTFPPRQKPGSFTLDQALAKLQEAGASRH
jgi:arylsulfatase